MFIHRDLFLPDSIFIQIFLLGHASLCKFMQVHAIIMPAYYGYFFYSLSRELSANLRCSSTSLPSLGPGYSLFAPFRPGPSLHQEVACTSKKQARRKLWNRGESKSGHGKKVEPVVYLINHLFVTQYASWTTKAEKSVSQWHSFQITFMEKAKLRHRCGFACKLDNKMEGEPPVAVRTLRN